MSTPVTDDLGDSWKPASLREAEARLAETLAKSAELIKQVDNKLKQLPDTDRTAKPEDVSALKAAAERPDASGPLRELKKKVDAGELTWPDVLEGKALKDETVRAVMSSRLGEMREIYQEAERGATLEEILQARGVQTDSVFAAGATASYPKPTPSAATPNDDDYFAGDVINSGSSATPPSAEPTPPAISPPPRSRPAPRPQRDEEYAEDMFEDPLASSHQDAKRAAPSGSTSSRPPREATSDDDYFDGPILR